jgi:hypothetical protein
LHKTLLPPDELFELAKADFNQVALATFRHQAEACPTYRDYLHSIQYTSQPLSPTDIPFLPVVLYKTHEVITGDVRAERVFHSSGTTDQVRSNHHVANLQLYKRSLLSSFELFLGPIRGSAILALLPPPESAPSSSLVYMVDQLIAHSGSPASGFHWERPEDFVRAVRASLMDGLKTTAISISYKWVELAERHPTDLSGAILVETGGMKGRREIIRQELHGIMSRAFQVKNVCSEYGMTELLSQAYAVSEGLFRCPPWMRVCARDILDPFSLAEEGQLGALNIIDLANQDSCAFVATDDLGRVHGDGSFEVLGRLDNSDLRGCNLLH